MIIQKQLKPENISLMHKSQDSGMEFKRIYKKASTSQDNDDLLKPIPRPKHIEEMNGQQNQSSKERTERNLWRNEEVLEMLYTMQQVNALEKLNDKTVKSENVFKDVEVLMHRNGFVKKSHVQIWTKWKFLKSTYMTSRRNGILPRIIGPQIYEIIHQMINNLNQSMADSCSSLDGDNSNVSGMVISGVEGGISNEGEEGEEEEENFGMAHPIFGFRLGMVKPEPEDTGYEPSGNNDSDKYPLHEELSNNTSDKKDKEEQNDVEKANKDAQPIQKVIEIPHRGRGRPPKNPPAATSTPNSTPSPAAMPPLRVAPFAKDNIQYANTNGTNRPPPPLTTPHPPRIRVANFSNFKETNSVKFTQPKLIPKPTQQQHSPSVQAVRTTKETTVQTRSSSTPSPSYPKMKQIPMRKTPYSLRPDRAIPDLESSLSPPPVNERLSNKKFEEVPSTKHLVMQSSLNNLQAPCNRKRRSDWLDPVPNKHLKYNNSEEGVGDNSKSLNIEYDKNYGKVLQNVIIDLSSSLRKMQTEMMRDFFNKQNDLLEREHKFQMQQDDMIMKAFQEQTQEIMQSVQHLVGSIKLNNNGQQSKQKLIGRMVNQNKNLHAREQRNELEGDEENELDDEAGQDQHREQDNEIEQNTEDMYSDDEQQIDQIEEQVQNVEEEIDNNADDEEENDNNEREQDDDHSQLVEQNENEIICG